MTRVLRRPTWERPPRRRALVHLSLLGRHCVPELVLDVVGANDDLEGARVERQRAGTNRSGGRRAHCHCAVPLVEVLGDARARASPEDAASAGAGAGAALAADALERAPGRPGGAAGKEETADASADSAALLWAASSGQKHRLAGFSQRLLASRGVPHAPRCPPPSPLPRLVFPPPFAAAASAAAVAAAPFLFCFWPVSRLYAQPEHRRPLQPAGRASGHSSCVISIAATAQGRPRTKRARALSPRSAGALPLRGRGRGGGGSGRRARAGRPPFGRGMSLPS